MQDEESSDTENMPYLKVLVLAVVESDQEESYDPYNTATNLISPGNE